MDDFRTSAAAATSPAFLKLDNLIKDPLFLEYINETLMTEHVKKSFEAVVQTVEVPELNDAELNALRYSAGYVPWKLKQKFSKRKDPYCKEYLTCLDGMRESRMLTNVFHTWSTQKGGYNL